MDVPKSDTQQYAVTVTIDQMLIDCETNDEDDLLEAITAELNRHLEDYELELSDINPVSQAELDQIAAAAKASAPFNLG